MVFIFDLEVLLDHGSNVLHPLRSSEGFIQITLLTGKIQPIQEKTLSVIRYWSEAKEGYFHEE